MIAPAHEPITVPPGNAGRAAPVHGALDPEEVPSMMRDARRWLVWKAVPNSNPTKKPRKIPYYASGRPRRGTLDTDADRDQLASIDVALLALSSGEYTGLGFALGPDGSGNHWQGVDLDDLTGRPQLRVLSDDGLPGYVESSPSGNGLHAIGYGRPFAPLGANSTGIEAYSAGRFFTVTGEGAHLGEPVDLADYVERTLRPLHRDSLIADEPHGVALEPAEHATPRQIAELRSALAFMRADDRHTWVANGARLRNLGEVGRGLWIEWAQTSSKWQPSDAQQWDTLRADHTGFRAVFSAAQADGWINPAGAAAQIQPQEPKVAKLGRVKIDDIMRVNPEPPQFAVEPIIPRGVVTLLGGHGGLGKSILGLIVAAHAACGRPWGPFVVKHVRAVFISLEDDSDVVRFRLRKIVEEYDLPAAEVIAGLSIFDGTTADAALVTEVSEAGTRRLLRTPMFAEVVDAVAGAGLVVIDNASDAFDGDENNRRQVRAFVRYMAQMARNNNAGLVVLAHIDKNAAKHGARGNSYSGSTAWHNSARSRLALLVDEGGLVLLHEKSNHGALAEPLPLARSAHGMLVPGASGSGLSAAIPSVVAAADSAAVLSVLRHAAAAGIAIPTARSGARTTWHALCEFPELPQELRNTRGKRRVAAALLDLERTACIARDEYRKPDRHIAERWAVISSPKGAAR